MATEPSKLERAIEIIFDLRAGRDPLSLTMAELSALDAVGALECDSDDR